MHAPPDDYPFQHGPDGWPLVRRILDETRVLFGSPSAIMFGRLHAGAVRGLSTLERRLNLLLALVRRLVLIEACALSAAPVARQKPRPHSTPKQKLPVQIYVVQAEPVVSFFTNKPRLKEDSATWRVALHLFPQPRRKIKRPLLFKRPAPHPTFKPSTARRTRMHQFRRIAARLEALRRVAADPARYARRVARMRLTRQPEWILDPFPGRLIGCAHAEIVRPAHIVALQTMIDSS